MHNHIYKQVARARLWGKTQLSHHTPTQGRAIANVLWRRSAVQNVEFGPLLGICTGACYKLPKQPEKGNTDFLSFFALCVAEAIKEEQAKQQEDDDNLCFSPPQIGIHT